MSALPAVGTFLVMTYGYDQTNVRFYKVLEHTPSGKSVRIQAWSQQVFARSSGPCEYVTPGKDPRVVRVWDKDYTKQTLEPAPIETKRWNGYAKVDQHYYATPWDGRQVYQTAPGWGH